MNNIEIIKQFLEYRQVNNKSENTTKSDGVVLKKLMKYAKNKPFRDINEQDTQGFLRSQKSIGTKTVNATKLIIFFRWLNKTGKRERPDNMRWFEYPSADLIRKNKDPDVKKYLITDEEYKKIQQNVGHEPKWAALFETLYLSGARPNEVNMMNVGDVEIDSDGKVTITLQDSKTLPRKVPLPENPKMLIRWLEYHPFKDNKNAPLFPSGHNYKYAKRMVTVSINYKFKSIKNHTGIKNSLTPHCFRKSRATIMFSSRNPFFDDSEIAKFFGWKSHTVIDRRQQYDLRDFDDLKKKIQGNIPRVETYDTIKQERDNLEKDLKEQVNKLTRLVQLIAERTGFDFDVDYLPATLKDMDNNPEYYLTEQELKNP